MERELSLAFLEKRYTGLAKKYKLPSFEQLNTDFEIDKIERETFMLLRLVRKVCFEKIVNTLNFLDMLLNPVNAPRAYLAYIKMMSPEDRIAVEQTYSTLSILSIASLDLEVDYSEKREATVILKVYSTWQSLKPNLRMILKNMQNINQNKTLASRKEKSYFG